MIFIAIAKKGRCGFSHAKRGLTTGLDQLWHVPASRPLLPCHGLLTGQTPPVLMEGKHPFFASGKNPSFGNKEKKRVPVRGQILPSYPWKYSSGLVQNNIFTHVYCKTL